MRPKVAAYQTKSAVYIGQADVVPGVLDVNETMFDSSINELTGDLGLVASGARDVDDGDVGLGRHGCGLLGWYRRIMRVTWRSEHVF